MRKKIFLLGLTIITLFAISKPGGGGHHGPTHGDGTCGAGGKTELTNILFFSGFDSNFVYYFINEGDSRFEKDTIKLSDTTFIATNYKKRNNLPSKISYKFRFIIKSVKRDTTLYNDIFEKDFADSLFTKHFSKVTFQEVKLNEIISSSVQPGGIQPPIKPVTQP